MSKEQLNQDAYDKVFEQVRGIVTQEDHLVSVRLGWNMTLNGFLYAALAALLLSHDNGISLSFSITSQDASQTLIPGVNFFVMLIIVTGFASAVTTLVSVWAAYGAIRRAARKFNEFVAGFQLEDKILDWDVISSEWHNKWGMVGGILNPFAVAIPWTGLVCYVSFLSRDLQTTEICILYWASVVLAFGCMGLTIGALCWICYGTSEPKENGTGRGPKGADGSSAGISASRAPNTPDEEQRDV